MSILETPLTRTQLLQNYCRYYEGMTKAVADLQTGTLAIEAEMHADLENILLENGSRQAHLWGFNIFPAKTGDDFLQYTSLINIRPLAGNTSMLVEDENLQREIRSLVNTWITDA